MGETGSSQLSPPSPAPSVYFAEALTILQVPTVESGPRADDEKGGGWENHTSYIDSDWDAPMCENVNCEHHCAILLPCCAACRGPLGTASRTNLSHAWR